MAENGKHKLKRAFSMVIRLCLAVLLLSSFCQLSQAQVAASFQPTDKFPIPNQNSTIRFAFNGSYTSATLRNNTWVFKNLNLSVPSATFLGLNAMSDLHTLKFSAKNSNITILAFQTFNYSSPVSVLSYIVEGEGTQTVNLGLDTAQPTDSSEWSVIGEDNVFLAEGQGWQLLADNSIVVSAAFRNITIVYFDYRDSGLEDLSFLLQHYVLLSAGVVLVVTIAVAVLIRTRRQKGLRNSNKQSAAT